MEKSILWFALVHLLHWSVAQDWPCAVLKEGVMIPHNFDCSLYYTCINGSKVPGSCPKATYFDEVNGKCDITAPKTGCVVNDSPTLCYGANNSYYPDPRDCSKYFECYQGQYYLQQCPGGTYFNSKTLGCADPHQVDCIVTPIAPPDDPVCLGVSANHIEVKGIPGYCSYYYICNGANYTLQQCPPRMYFDPHRETCDFPPFAPCTTNIPGTPNSNATLLPPQGISPSADPRCATLSYDVLPVPITCTHYVMCSSGEAYEIECPNGAYFSEALKKCVAPNLSGCTERGATPSPPIVKPPDAAQSGDCPYPVADGRLMPFPGNCNKYYECAEGIKVEMDCPAGLWWHQQIGECDYPYLAGCIY